MKAIKIILLVIVSLFGLVVLTAAAALLIDSWNTSYLDIDNHPESRQNSYFITHVNVVPMTADTILENTTVKIVDGSIRSIGENSNDENLPEINADGKFLTPGLIDMHVHIWDKYELGLYLANSVTAVRNLWGHPMHLRMKKEINDGDILSPTFFTSGPKLTGPKFIGDDNLQLFSPEEAREKVADYKARGYDLIKTYYGLTPDIFDAVIDECKKQDIDIAAHPSNEVPYDYHFQAPIKTLEHAEEIVQQPLAYDLDTTKLNAVIQQYTNYPSAALCPTIVVYHNIYRLMTVDNILNRDELAFMNPLIRMVDSKAQYDRWSNSKANDSTVVPYILKQHNFHLLAVRKLHEQNVNIVCGTDAGIGVTLPGYSIHKELEFYKSAGMTNYEALKTATINPTKTHDFLKNMGTIEPGKLANFVLTKDNPLEDVSALQTPELVMVKGRKIESETLKEFEEKAKNRSNLLVTGLRYVENLIVEK